MTNSEASRIGLGALGYIATDDELRGVFLDWSGLDGSEISSRAQEAEFHGFVLDFILQSDEMVVGVASALSCTPEMVMEARMVLPGGDTPHWT